MERAFYISKFRNIGFGENKYERFVLNNSLEQDKIGNLICLIGPNNSGKSNVISALSCFANKKIEQRDVTSLSFNEEDRNPSLSLVCRDGEDKYEFKISYNNGTYYYDYPLKNQVQKFTFTSDLATLKQILDFISNNANRFGCDSLTYRALIHQVTENNESLEDIERKTIELFTKIIKNYSHFWNHIKNEFYNSILINECTKYIETKIDHQTNLFTSFKEKYGYNFLPEIVNYKEKIISSNSLICTPDSITNNEFFNNLFKKISDTSSPQGIIALCSMPEKKVDINKNGRYIALENIGWLT